MGGVWELINYSHINFRLVIKDKMSTVTSFKKKSSSKPSHPHGTRPSFHNAQLLVSTGVPSLDPLLGKIYIIVHALMSLAIFLGGGICVGSILLIGRFYVV